MTGTTGVIAPSTPVAVSRLVKTASHVVVSVVHTFEQGRRFLLTYRNPKTVGVVLDVRDRTQRSQLKPVVISLSERED